MKRSDEVSMIKRRLAGELPEIDIAGSPFVVHWECGELIPKEAGTVIRLTDMPMTEDGRFYLCFYDTTRHVQVTVREDITRLPRNTVMLKIPYELVLDPVGVARQYGLNDVFMLDRYPITPGLKAEVIQIGQTGLPQLVAANRRKMKMRRKHGDKL